MKKLLVPVLLIVIMFCLAVLAQTPAPKTLDRTDAAATATAVLKAYAAKDLPAMAALSTADSRQIIEELIKLGENHPRWRSIFVGGRWDAVSNWNGKPGEIRYFEHTSYDVKHFEARMQFAELEPGRLVVVNLEWEGGKWCFEDINFPSRESFEKGSKTRPAIP